MSGRKAGEVSALLKKGAQTRKAGEANFERNKLLEDQNALHQEINKQYLRSASPDSALHISQEEYNALLDRIVADKARPSGADLDNIVKKLRQEAFYTRSFADTGSAGEQHPILITDEVIERVFRTSNEPLEG